ncbi:hypothetical protein PQR67_36650 [Paraburkholderia fungorum]|uniref:hypothetical protein n=1 Tax=Paraburkholderia fungorum TaxID=134537 RepID=UPI0038B7201F
MKKLTQKCKRIVVLNSTKTAGAWTAGTDEEYFKAITESGMTTGLDAIGQITKGASVITVRRCDRCWILH